MKPNLDAPDALPDPRAPGLYEPRHLAFLATLPQLRPSLHRYCSRMTGSPLTGEDVVQEALFLAFREIEGAGEPGPSTARLFQLAHDRSLDHLRRHEAGAEGERPASTDPAGRPGEVPAPSFERLVFGLPPDERACVLLRDDFDHSLEEIAELVGSTVGEAEAALDRGRARLAEAGGSGEAARPEPGDPAFARFVERYVERFNLRDWDALRELGASEARLLIADRYSGPLDGSLYFGRWEEWQIEWRFQAGEMDGRPVAVILLRGEDGHWAPRSFVHLEVEEGRLRRIADYLHCPWVAELEGLVLLPGPS